MNAAAPRPSTLQIAPLRTRFALSMRWESERRSDNVEDRRGISLGGGDGRRRGGGAVIASAIVAALLEERLPASCGRSSGPAATTRPNRPSPSTRPKTNATRS